MPLSRDEIVKRFFFGAMVVVLMAGRIFAQDNATAASDTVKTVVADSLARKGKNPTGAMLRSIVFPGWGQWYNGKHFKAILVFGAEAGIIANTIRQNQRVQASKSELEREFYLENRRLSNWWLAGVILLSMIDAYVDAHLYDFDESPNLGARPTAVRENERAQEVVWFWRAQIQF